MTVELRRWSPGDLGILTRGNEPAMTAHLGGSESDEQVLARHARYLRGWDDGSARMFAIALDGAPVGGIGWWSTQWRDQLVHETGWFVLPEAQGRGVAARAARSVVEDARDHGDRGWLLAFPAVANDVSNRLCARAGFRLQGSEQFPFRGTVLTVNTWAVDLDALRGADAARRVRDAAG